MAVTLFFSACRKELITSPTGFSYDSTKFTGTAGTARTTKIPNITWNGTGRFMITNPSFGGGIAGINIDETTGEITWSASTPAGSYSLEIKATNAVGTLTSLDTIILNGVSYATLNSTVVANNATGGSSIKPTIIGLTGGTFETIGTLPTGVTLTPGTGVIAWTNAVPTAVAGGDTTYSFKVKHSLFKDTFNHKLTVKAKVARFAYNNTSQSVNIGSANDYVLAAPILTDTNSTSRADFSIQLITKTLVTYPVAVTSTNDPLISVDKQTGAVTFSKSLPSGSYILRINKGTPFVDDTLTVRDYFTYGTATATYTSSSTGSSNSVTPVFTGTKGVYLLNRIQLNGTTIKAVNGLKIDPSTGVLSWSRPIAQGTYAIRVQNSNVSCATVNYTLTVN